MHKVIGETVIVIDECQHRGGLRRPLRFVKVGTVRGLQEFGLANRGWLVRCTRQRREDSIVCERHVRLWPASKSSVCVLFGLDY